MVARQHILVSLVNDSISSSLLIKLVILLIHWSVQLSELMKTIYYIIIHIVTISVPLRPVPIGPISRRPTPIIGRLYCRVGRFYHRFCNSRPTAPIKHV